MANKKYTLALDVSTKSTGIALADENGHIVRSYEIKTTSDTGAFASRMASDMTIIEKELLGVGKALQYIVGAHDMYNEYINNHIMVRVREALTTQEYTLIKNKDNQKPNPKLDELLKKANKIKQKAWDEADKIELLVVIETNKVQVNQDVKQKLDLYAGMYLGYIVNMLNTLAPYFIKEYKLSNPTEWRAHAYGYFPERKEAKELAIERANKLLKEQGQDREVEGDDEAEAIIIATVADHLRDIATIYNQRQAKAKELSKLRGQLPRYEGLVKKYELIQKEKQKQGRELNKTEAKVLETNLSKVSEIKTKISKLNKGVHNGTRKETN